MKALDCKLLRDLRTMWSQALTIALVVASGVSGFLTSLSAVDSLEAARETFYAEGRFADLFASVKRAPAVLAEQLRSVPGVADVQTMIEQVVRIQIAGSSDPVLGQLIGIDALQSPRLNQLSVVASRGLFSAGDSGGAAATGSMDTVDALVSQGFAQMRGLMHRGTAPGRVGAPASTGVRLRAPLDMQFLVGNQTAVATALR